MLTDATTLPDNVNQLKEIISNNISNQKVETSRYQSIIADLEEQLNLYRARLFGRKSEKSHPTHDDQMIFFGDEGSSDVENDNSEDETITIPEHKRKKSGRKPIPDNLPREEIIHDLSEDQKTHSCGKQMKVIGEEVSEKLRIIPEKIIVERHIRLKYGCVCEGVHSMNGEPAVKIAPVPDQIIPKSIATPSLLAYILISKFCDGLPFYRQEKMFLRRGIELSRQNMSSWAIQIWKRFGFLQGMMDIDIRGGPFVGMDETRIQVLNEHGKLNTSISQMWVCRGELDKKKIISFSYSPDRKADNINRIIQDYGGYLQCDGYPGYDCSAKLNSNIKLVGCWAHARRKFFDVIKSGQKGKNAIKAMQFIKELYKIEKMMKKAGYSNEEKEKTRKDKSIKILNKFKVWLDEKKLSITPTSTLGKAINYTLNQWGKLIVYTEKGFLNIDNNLVENAIRPFVIGRKNWLFNNCPDGAHAAAFIYSLIETAKANDLDSYWYVLYLFEKLPGAKTEEEYRNLLPYNTTKEDLQKHFITTLRFN